LASSRLPNLPRRRRVAGGRTIRRDVRRLCAGLGPGLALDRPSTDTTAMTSTYLFEPAPVVSVPVRGETARFPVRRIYCVGRNYAEHAREMGHDPTREPPFFFLKNPDNLVLDGADFPYPDASSDAAARASHCHQGSSSRTAVSHLPSRLS
jgi:2-keto-4-pentenoate hydratase/2-oxohepta-3-ene-1,7-dioic acid hydratase in catechol pathway